MRILYHILYPSGLGDDRFTYEGYKEAFEDSGHEVFPLKEKMDFQTMLTSLAPDIFIEEGGLLMQDMSTKIEVLRNFRRRGGRVVLHGAISSKLSIVVAREDIVDVYFSETDPTIEFEDFPIELFRKMHWLAASRRIHGGAKPIPRYGCDVIYIGANLPKKQEAFEELLLPLREKYRTKIFGFGWDFVDRSILRPLAKAERVIPGSGFISMLRIMRQVPIDMEGSAYASAKISINFHEKQPGADIRTINARTFKIPASGGFELCDYVPQVREFFEDDEVVMPHNKEAWFEQIDYYVRHDAEREKIRAKGRERALREHTYHHRVSEILTCLGKPD